MRKREMSLISLGNLTLIYDLKYAPSSKNAPYFKSLWPCKCYRSFGTVSSRGNSILFKPNIQHTVIQEEYSSEGNYVILLYTVFTKTYTMVSVYDPNEDRPMFFGGNKWNNQRIVIRSFDCGRRLQFRP